MTTQAPPDPTANLVALPSGEGITVYAQEQLRELFDLTPEEAVRLAPPTVKTLQELFRELHIMGREGIAARRKELDLAAKYSEEQEEDGTNPQPGDGTIPPAGELVEGGQPVQAGNGAESQPAATVVRKSAKPRARRKRRKAPARRARAQDPDPGGTGRDAGGAGDQQVAGADVRGEPGAVPGEVPAGDDPA